MHFNVVLVVAQVDGLVRYKDGANPYVPHVQVATTRNVQNRGKFVEKRRILLWPLSNDGY